MPLAELPRGWPWTLTALVLLANGPLLWFGQDWEALGMFVIASAMLLRGWAKWAVAGVQLLITELVGVLGALSLPGSTTTLVVVIGVYSAVMPALYAGALIGGTRLVQLVNELYATRTELAASAVGEERVRLSRDLHDLLGQSLSAISLKGDLALRLLAKDPAAARAEIESLTEVAREALRDTRAIARDEHAVSLSTELDGARSRGSPHPPGRGRTAGSSGSRAERTGLGDPRRNHQPAEAQPGPFLRHQLVAPSGHGTAGDHQRRCPRDRRARLGPVRCRRTGPRGLGNSVGHGPRRTVPVPRRGPRGGHVIRVLIAEDMHMIRSALVALLTLEDDMEVVAELERGDTVVATALRVRPDVAVLDIDMPGLDGLTAAEHLHDKLPGCRTLVLTGLSQPGNLLRALKVHVQGFIVKDAPAQTLTDGIRLIARGERVIDPDLVAAALDQQPPHRPRDRGSARRRDRCAGDPDRHRAVAVAGHRAQLPVERDRQGRSPQPHRRHPHLPRRWLALDEPARPATTPARWVRPLQAVGITSFFSVRSVLGVR